MNIGLNWIRERGTLCALLGIVVFFPAAAAGQSRGAATRDGCAGPTDSVRLMAFQDPDNQQAYVFVLKNETKQRILAVIVGMGIKSELHIAPWAEPSQIVAPAGWKANFTYHEDSLFMHWVWVTEAPDLMIAPGELASGFKIVLPPFPPKAETNRYPDGAPVRPIKVMELPFQAAFTDGKCVWGRIQPLVVGARAR